MNLRTSLLGWPVLVACAWAAGCSASNEKPAQSTGNATVEDAGQTVDAVSAADNAPGTLPDGCPKNSGYVGDESCLAAPPADQGFQLHYGPPDYTVATDLQPFVLLPGKETNDCFYVKATNDEERYVSGLQFYMRPGSHHLIVGLSPPHADGFDLCGLADQTGGLGGSQTPRVDALTDPAPENQGLATRVPAHAQTFINFHVLDSSNQPILREAWLNFMYIDPAKVKGIRGPVALTGGLGFHIDPGTHQNYTYSCKPERPIRILNLASHMHAHAKRMTAWKVSNTGQANLVYQSFSWAEPPSFRFDSVTTNPKTDAATQTSGAISGTLTVNPDESIQWECEILNDGDDVLTFRNEVQTGEMCLLTGAEVPTDDPMNPYDFTCSHN